VATSTISESVLSSDNHPHANIFYCMGGLSTISGGIPSHRGSTAGISRHLAGVGWLWLVLAGPFGSRFGIRIIYIYGQWVRSLRAHYGCHLSENHGAISVRWMAIAMGHSDGWVRCRMMAVSVMAVSVMAAVWVMSEMQDDGSMGDGSIGDGSSMGDVGDAG
jgi:hypothetical protein